MFDFLAHWFAKTEIIHNEKGKAITRDHKSFFKNGHFSLDLTFICFIVISVLIYLLYKKFINKLKVKYNNQNFNDIEMQLINPPRSNLNVERTPIQR
jgi:cytochrome oxidase assembly protein ShyY1